MTRIALCIDEATCKNPALAGLDGESLDNQPWIDVHLDGASARSALREDELPDEVWVLSCEDVAPINLAATLKADCPEVPVRLISFEEDGSLRSRAHTASIDEVMSARTFLARYGEQKAQHLACFTDPASRHAVDEPRGYGAAPTLAPETEQDAPSARIALVERPPDPGQSTRALALTPSTAKRMRGFVMPVVSGSGGAGKSTVSVLGAFIAHCMGYKTLLLDYDLQFGDAAVMAGIENPLTIDEVLARPEKLENELARTDRPALIAAPPRLEQAESVAQSVPQLLDKLAQSFDVIVANTGSAWAEQHAALLERSTSALFLIDQRSSSLAACRHALDLCARCGIATGQFRFTLNRCAKNAPLTSMDVSSALQGAIVAELRDGGRDVEEYLAAGAAADLLQTDNELCASLRRLMAEQLPGADANAAVSKGFALAKRRGRHSGKRKGWGK